MRLYTLSTFLLIGLLPLLVTGSLAVYQIQQHLKKEAEDNVVKAAQSYSYRLQDYLEKQVALLSLASSNQSLRNHLYRHINLPDEQNMRRIQSILEEIKGSVSEFDDLFILDTQGNFTVSSKNYDYDQYKTSLLELNFDALNFKHGTRKLQSMSIKVEQLYYDRQSQLKILLSGPVLKEGQLLGRLFIVIRGHFIESLGIDAQNLGRDTEVLITKKNDDHGITLTNITSGFDVKVYDTRSPAYKAASGSEQLFFDTRDYKGDNVIAASRYIDVSDWGVVTRLDTTILKQQLHHTRYFLVLSIIITAFSVCILALITSSKIKYQIKKVSNAIGKIRDTEDDMEPVIETGNELKALERKFNVMAEEIHHKLAIERELKCKAETSDQDKVSFITNLGYELNTALHQVIGLLQEGMDQTVLPPMVQKQLLDARHSATTLKLLTDNALDYARLESGELQLLEESFSIKEIIRESTRTLQTALDEKSLSLDVNIDAGLPEKFIGDSIRLRQIITTIIDNAIKYTPSGSIKVNVENTSKTGIDTDVSKMINVHIAIEDKGGGIAHHQYPGIIQAFSDDDKPTTGTAHETGLGLTLAFKLMHLMGGRIHVDNRVGEGSTFHLYVPLLQDCCMDEAVKTDNAFSHPLKILLAEDNIVNQKIMQRLLESWGHQCIVTNDGEKTIRTVNNETFDVILMDIQMPLLDGIAATRLIRRVMGLKHIPIIAITAHISEKDRSACFDAGMNGFITKPVDKRLLEIKIINLTQQSKQAIEA